MMMNSEYINQLDYLSLVNMLLTQITPILRKQILDRLTEMNNQFLDINQISTMNSSKISIPFGTSQYNDKITDDYDRYFDHSKRTHQPINKDTDKMYQRAQTERVKINQRTIDEIDLDNIIDDLYDKKDADNESSNNLDIKLANIKKLHTKIIADKKRRKRKERKLEPNL